MNRDFDREKVWLFGVFLFALLVRLVYFLQIQKNPFFDTLILDDAIWDRLGIEIAQGDFLGSQVFRPPLYPYFLGFPYKLFGHHSAIHHVHEVRLKGAEKCS